MPPLALPGACGAASPRAPLGARAGDLSRWLAEAVEHILRARISPFIQAAITRDNTPDVGFEVAEDDPRLAAFRARSVLGRVRGV